MRVQSFTDTRRPRKGCVKYMHKGLQKQGSHSSSAFFFKGSCNCTMHTLVEKVTFPAPRQVLKFKHMGGPINPNGGTQVWEAHG